MVSLNKKAQEKRNTNAVCLEPSCSHAFGGRVTPKSLSATILDNIREYFLVPKEDFFTLNQAIERQTIPCPLWGRAREGV